MVFVEFPKFAVNDVKVLVTKRVPSPFASLESPKPFDKTTSAELHEKVFAMKTMKGNCFCLKIVLKIFVNIIRY